MLLLLNIFFKAVLKKNPAKPFVFVRSKSKWGSHLYLEKNTPSFIRNTQFND